jgi:hypothetical protein
MKYSSFLLTICFCVCYAVSTQAQVVVNTPPQLSNLVEKHIAANKLNTGKLMGFCVQICFESGSNSRERAEKYRVAFLSKYPKYNAHLTFKEPNFRVRVGDFRTRAEARGFKEKIAMDFPQSFVVKDEVRYPKQVFDSK